MPLRRTSQPGNVEQDRDHVDPAWVERLAGCSRDVAKKALEEARGESELARDLEEAYRRGHRDFYAQIRAPYELYALVRILRPRHLVEVGVSSGCSSAYFLQALKRNRSGKLHSIDLPTAQKGSEFSTTDDSPVALPPGERTGWAVPERLRPGWDLRLGPSSELLPSLVKELDAIGIFLHDSLHTYENATFELTTVDPKVPAGGLFLADNTAWLDGALDRFAERKGTRALYRKGTDLGGFRKL